MSETSIDLVDRLVDKFPVLETLLREHLAANFGEVLPHPFFGDLTRFATGEFSRLGSDQNTKGSLPAQRLRQLLDELEWAFVTGPDEVTNLIAVSFLGNLPRRGEEGDGLRDLLGPRLQSELERME